MNKMAQPNHIFVLTEKGYKFRKDRGITDVEIGEPFPERETTVPESWVERGWVEEKEVSE